MRLMMTSQSPPRVIAASESDLERRLEALEQAAEKMDGIVEKIEAILRLLGGDAVAGGNEEKKN